MASKAPASTGPKRTSEDDKPKETGRGIIKAVNSGDAVVIAKVGVATGGPPPEIELALSLLTAPRLGRRGDSDEPWAWESREFLRRALIGQQIIYTVEYKAPESGRAIGTVSINGENIAKSVAQAGWARVRRPPEGKEPRSDFHAELITLSTAAEEAKIGVFQDATLPNAIRPIIAQFDTIRVYEKLKLRPLDAIIEYVRDGSTVRIELLETHHNILFKVAGVQSPIFKKGEGAAAAVRPEPYAREAKYFTESNLLHRDVQVVLRGVSKSDEFCGSISMKGRDLGEELLRNGLASFVNWNAPQERADAMRAIEQAAKARKLRIWDKWVPKAAEVSTQSFSGKVREIQNRGVLVVQDANGTKHVVSMSSINVPALGIPRRGEEAAARNDELGAWDAREFLRTRLIGKKVQVDLDYTKPASTTSEGRSLPEKHFFTVTEGKANIAVQLVERGLAKVVYHSDENRSPAYQQMVVAEKHAQTKAKGVWKSGKAEAHHVNDLTSNGDKKGVDMKKAKQVLSFLKDKGRLHGVVEFVLSGSKLKVHIPKEGCMILFSVEGVRCPRQGEPFGDEALEFAREKLHQRDIEVSITSLDKAGSFTGSAFVGGANYGAAVLEAGFAEVFGPALDRSPNKVIYSESQLSAKIAKRGIWHDWSEEKEQEAAAARREAREARDSTVPTGNQREVLTVSVTEVVDASQFYVHVLGDGVAQLETLMGELNAMVHVGNPTFSRALKRADRAVCKFTDDRWYRVQVLRISPDKTEAEIRYIDYGNTEVIEVEALLPLPPQFSALRPQAVEASLAYLKVPTLDDDYGSEAAQFFRDLVWDKTLTANVEYREGEKLYVVLGDSETQQLVNVVLVAEGLGLIDRKKSAGCNPSLMKSLRTEQDSARSNRRNQWQYGDVPDEDLDGL